MDGENKIAVTVTSAEVEAAFQNERPPGSVLCCPRDSLPLLRGLGPGNMEWYQRDLVAQDERDGAIALLLGCLEHRGRDSVLFSWPRDLEAEALALLTDMATRVLQWQTQTSSSKEPRERVKQCYQLCTKLRQFLSEKQRYEHQEQILASFSPDGDETKTTSEHGPGADGENGKEKLRDLRSTLDSKQHAPTVCVNDPQDADDEEAEGSSENESEAASPTNQLLLAATGMNLCQGRGTSQCRWDPEVIRKGRFMRVQVELCGRLEPIYDQIWKLFRLKGYMEGTPFRVKDKNWEPATKCLDDMISLLEEFEKFIIDTFCDDKASEAGTSENAAPATSSPFSSANSLRFFTRAHQSDFVVARVLFDKLLRDACGLHVSLAMYVDAIPLYRRVNEELYSSNAPSGSETADLDGFEARKLARRLNATHEMERMVAKCQYLCESGLRLNELFYKFDFNWIVRHGPSFSNWLGNPKFGETRMILLLLRYSRFPLTFVFVPVVTREYTCGADFPGWGLVYLLAEALTVLSVRLLVEEKFPLLEEPWRLSTEGWLSEKWMRTAGDHVEGFPPRNSVPEPLVENAHRRYPTTLYFFTKQYFSIIPFLATFLPVTDAVRCSMSSAGDHVDEPADAIKAAGSGVTTALASSFPDSESSAPVREVQVVSSASETTTSTTILDPMEVERDEHDSGSSTSRGATASSAALFTTTQLVVTKTTTAASSSERKVGFPSGSSLADLRRAIELAPEVYGAMSDYLFSRTNQGGGTGTTGTDRVAKIHLGAGRRVPMPEAFCRKLFVLAEHVRFQLETHMRGPPGEQGRRAGPPSVLAVRDAAAHIWPRLRPYLAQQDHRDASKQGNKSTSSKANKHRAKRQGKWVGKTMSFVELVGTSTEVRQLLERKRELASGLSQVLLDFAKRLGRCTLDPGERDDDLERKFMREEFLEEVEVVGKEVVAPTSLRSRVDGPAVENKDAADDLYNAEYARFNAEDSLDETDFESFLLKPMTEKNAHLKLMAICRACRELRETARRLDRILAPTVCTGVESFASENRKSGTEEAIATGLQQIREVLLSSRVVGGGVEDSNAASADEQWCLLRDEEIYKPPSRVDEEKLLPTLMVVQDIKTDEVLRIFEV
ncbi:unnamed protein product [Amoebophrya sp. A120]|nr:unnamed protein product [Amoebophrya sp. A120]|eukprot:GSA120T00014133001.1